MALCDLHFHLNIHNQLQRRRHQWLQDQYQSIKYSGIDFLASTEHVYKDALEAFLYLRDTVHDLPVTIIPGVEWVSKEKAEVVFLFEDRSSLEPALKTLKPFSHSIWDIGGLGGDLAGLTIIPHPFTPGKTGAGNLLGPDGLLRLLELADYVEIHNGLARQFDELILFGRLKRLPLGLMRRIRDTACLPDRFRPPSLGWSVGSDAHFPGELHMAGQADGIDPDNWFAALRGRLRFAKVDLPTPGFPPGRLAKNFRSLRLVMREAWLKARCK